MRRAAREYALRALYQIDVAPQPLSGVLQGILEQIRMPVNHAIDQHLRDAAARGREVAQTALKQAGPGDRRRIRKTLKGIGECLAALGTRLGEVTAEAVSADPMPLDECLVRIEEALCEASQQLDQIAAKEPLHAPLVEAARSRLDAIADAFRRHAPEAAAVASFAIRLVTGTRDHMPELDRRLAALSAHWSLWRQAAVDRNILRLAAFELLFEHEPAAAIINEAVELAKKYSTDESGRFVNGILGALAAEIRAPEASPLER
ncbi:MAG: transcription antitermination factor NusB [Chthonomonadales bacterium]